MNRIEELIGSHIWTSSFSRLEFFDYIKCMPSIDLQSGKRKIQFKRIILRSLFAMLPLLLATTRLPHSNQSYHYAQTTIQLVAHVRVLLWLLLAMAVQRALQLVQTVLGSEMIQQLFQSSSGLQGYQCLWWFVDCLVCGVRIATISCYRLYITIRVLYSGLQPTLADYQGYIDALGCYIG